MFDEIHLSCAEHLVPKESLRLAFQHLWYKKKKNIHKKTENIVIKSSHDSNANSFDEGSDGGAGSGLF